MGGARLSRIKNDIRQHLFQRALMAARWRSANLGMQGHCRKLLRHTQQLPDMINRLANGYGLPRFG